MFTFKNNLFVLYEFLRFVYDKTIHVWTQGKIILRMQKKILTQFTPNTLKYRKGYLNTILIQPMEY